MKIITLLFTVLLLSGCMTPSAAHRTTMILNAGADLPPEMWGRNIVAMVAFDEVPAPDYNRHSQVVLYSQGARKGSEIYHARIVRVNFNHFKGNWAYRDGTVGFYSAAIVPDHLPPLKRADVVELRHVRTWESLLNFFETGDGNMVIRVLCARSDPDYDECLEKLPRIGRATGQGPTGTHFPESAREYGFTFSTRTH